MKFILIRFNMRDQLHIFSSSQCGQRKSARIQILNYLDGQNFLLPRSSIDEDSWCFSVGVGWGGCDAVDADRFPRSLDTFRFGLSLGGAVPLLTTTVLNKDKNKEIIKNRTLVGAAKGIFNVPASTGCRCLRPGWKQFRCHPNVCWAGSLDLRCSSPRYAQ